MSILSLSYLFFSAESAVLTWLFPNRTRKYTVFIINCFFLFLLRANLSDVIYVVCLTLWVYACGWWMEQKMKSPAILTAAVSIPVIGLLVCKYAGYFGMRIIMPLGISFYTFKGLSYLFDVYRKKVNCRDIVSVFDYMIFFPVFMAGPINRAPAFFEELEKPWVFEYRDQKNGFVQACLGVVEKMVIADQLSAMVKAFLNPELSGWYTVFGVILYAFQLYADFDAYSNVAIGIARMMGFHLERNFHSPYLSSSIAEFWRRWHISLSSWLRDYVYIPLGGNRKGTGRKIINILIVFVISGLWHGSTMMFLIWGLGHALLHILEGGLRPLFREQKWVNYLKPVWIIINFAFVAVLWVFFRSETMAEAMGILNRMTMIHGLPSISYETAMVTQNELVWTYILIIILIVIDFLRYHRDMIEFLADRFIITRWVFYAVVIVISIIFGVYGPGYHPEDFIYVTF